MRVFLYAPGYKNSLEHEMPQLFKSKTIWFAILLSILPIFAQYIGAFNLTPLQQMVAMQLIAAAVAVLRIITTQPISEK